MNDDSLHNFDKMLHKSLFWISFILLAAFCQIKCQAAQVEAGYFYNVTRLQ